MRTRQVYCLVPVLVKWNVCSHCGESFVRPWSAMVFLQYSCKNLHVPRTRVWQLRTARGCGAVSTGMELWIGRGKQFKGVWCSTVVKPVCANLHWQQIYAFFHFLCERFAWPKGGHLYVPCRSVYDWDQNWIKWPKTFWGANQEIKVTSRLLKLTDQKCMAAI